MVALIPKPGATSEAQLRPIGIMPYTYRVWMAARRSQARDWSLSIHGGTHIGAAAMAHHTHTTMELAHWRHHHVAMALIVCSKCYERVEHYQAQSDAATTGCPADIVSTALAHYGGKRILRANGAVGPAVSGAHGIIAGCAYAKDILKAFLLPIARQTENTTFRDYVDDMTLLSVAETPTQAVLNLHEDLQRIKAKLRSRNMQ